MKGVGKVNVPRLREREREEEKETDGMVGEWREFWCAVHVQRECFSTMGLLYKLLNCVNYFLLPLFNLGCDKKIDQIITTQVLNSIPYLIGSLLNIIS